MPVKTIRVSGSLDHAFAVSVAAGDHVVRMDQPRHAAGQDLGPTPLELVLAALAGCFGTIGRIVAHQRKFELRGMHFEIEGDYDPDGLLGRRDDVRPGFQALRMKVDLDADLSRRRCWRRSNGAARWPTTCCTAPAWKAAWPDPPPPDGAATTIAGPALPPRRNRTASDLP